MMVHSLSNHFQSVIIHLHCYTGWCGVWELIYRWDMLDRAGAKEDFGQSSHVQRTHDGVVIRSFEKVGA